MALGARRSVTPFDDRLLLAVAAAAALAATTAGGAPTGREPVDVAFRAGLAFVVTLAGARARRWALLVSAGLATGAASGAVYLPAVAALSLALVLAARRDRLRLLGGVAAALAVQALLRLDLGLFHGDSALVAGAAVVPVAVSAHRRTRGRLRRRHRIGAGVVAGSALVAVAGFGVAMALAAPHLRSGTEAARDALAAARQGDTGAAEQHLRRSASSFRAARRLTGGLLTRPAALVPGVAQHLRAVDVATAQGIAITEAGTGVARVGSYADLKYESGRIDLDKVRQLGTPLSRADQVLRIARSQLATVDRSWLVGPADRRLRELSDEVARAGDDASMAARAVAVAPGLLGGDGSRTYFVAFVNPAEERGGGGFLGNYAELTALDGKVTLTRSGPIRELINARPPGERRLDGPDDFLARYGQYAPADFLQDITFSPHFPTTADVIGQLYPQSGGTEVDGVISLDPYAMAALLRLTGPIDVPGYDEPLTADNAADVILRKQYLQFGVGRDVERKDVLVEASRITFDRLTSGSLPAPERLVDLLGPMVAERRLQLAATRPAEQDLFEAIGADGALPSPDGGDVLMVAHQNFGNNKIDAYLERTIRYEPRIDPMTGQVSSTATITLGNTALADGLPPIVTGNSREAPVGTNLMVLSIFSALDVVGAELDGVELTMASSVEEGLRVHTARIDVAPSTVRTLVVRLAGGLDLASHGYRLTVVPQPSVRPDPISVRATTSGGWRPSEPAAIEEDDGGRTLHLATGFHRR